MGILWPWKRQNVSYYFHKLHVYIDTLLYGVAFDSTVTNFSKPPLYLCMKKVVTIESMATPSFWNPHE